MSAGGATGWGQPHAKKDPRAKKTQARLRSFQTFFSVYETRCCCFIRADDILHIVVFVFVFVFFVVVERNNKSSSPHPSA